MRISSITKNAGKACNNRLYRHIRTFKKIVKNYFVIYLKNLNLPLFDREIIQSLQTNYADDFLDSASVSKRMRESILNKLLPLFDKAGLELICERNPSKRTLVIKSNID